MQDIVDALAGATRRPVIITDEHFRLRAHSCHGRIVDAAARACILNRAYPTAAVEHFIAHGVDLLLEPAEIPSPPHGGLLRRFCVPMGWHRRRLGYVWLIMDGADLTGADRERCITGAARATAAMLRECHIATRRCQDDQRLFQRLFDAELEEREGAIDELTVAGRVGPTTQAKVIVGSVEQSPNATTSAMPNRSAFGDALDRLRQAHDCGDLLVGSVGNSAVAVATGVSRSAVVEDAVAAAECFQTILAEVMADAPGATPVVGVGGSVSMRQLSASLAQARASARVATVDARHRPIASWDTIGIFRALTLVPEDDLATPADVHPGLAALLEHRSGNALLTTAESYLDLGADASATAAMLHLHRSSLYYRLGKCQSIAGIDFRNGEDRLALHIGIKLARLRGWWPQA